MKIGLPRVGQSVFKEDGLLELMNCDPGEDFGNWDRFFHDLRDFDTDFVDLHIPYYGLCDWAEKKQVDKTIDPVCERDNFHLDCLLVVLFTLQECDCNLAIIVSGHCGSFA